MDLSAINSEMQAAYDAALVNPIKQAATQVGEDPNQTVQTVTYVAPTGAGFRVIGRIKVGGFTATKVLNHGPDTASERDWPAEGIEAAVSAFNAKCIKAAETHISKFFTAFGLMEGLKKLMTAQATNSLASIPKTVAVATWVETVKGMALAGQLNFPPSPYPFEEIIAE